MYYMMRKETNRLKTFQMNPSWPNNQVDIKKLAKAGFFYAFKDDNVHCAFCRGQVCRWDRDDDPMAEHARHFTTCPFIMGGDVGNIPFGEDPFPGPKRPRPYDVCGFFPNFPHDDSRNRLQGELNLQLLQAASPLSDTSSFDSNNGAIENLATVCKICYERTIQLVFLPCGHSVSCIRCSRKLYLCPFCRGPISARIRTFIV